MTIDLDEARERPTVHYQTPFIDEWRSYSDYFRAVFNDEYSKLADAAEGSRNASLFVAATELGKFIAGSYYHLHLTT